MEYGIIECTGGSGSKVRLLGQIDLSVGLAAYAALFGVDRSDSTKGLESPIQTWLAVYVEGTEVPEEVGQLTIVIRTKDGDWE
jgi:hypothetical protein